MDDQLQERLTQLEATVLTLQTQNAALQNEVTALQAAAPAAVPPAPPAPAPVAAATAPHVVVYAENPGRYDVESIIDYNSRLGITIYDQGTKPLATKFDMTPAGLSVFLHSFQERCTEMGWSEGTKNITKFTNSNGQVIDLRTQFGQCDALTMKTQCERFCKPGGADYGTRATQNNHMMGGFLISSLSPEALARLQPHRAEFTFDDKIYAPLLLKTMMRLAIIDSVATTEALRANLRELSSYAASVSGDIDLINQNFDQNYSQLIARGAQIDDPIGILFDAYRTVTCSHFHTYITRKHEMYLDGELTLTHEELMASATDKFNYLKTKGLWGSKSEQEQIVAMAAEFEKIKGELALAKSLQAAAKDNTQPSKSSNKSFKGKKETKKKNKKNKSDRKHQKQDEAWKKIPPKAGEAKQKIHKELTWHWCDNHMQWTIHTPADCKKLNLPTKSTEANSATTDVASPAISSSSLPSAYAALLANMARSAADE